MWNKLLTVLAFVAIMIWNWITGLLTWGFITVLSLIVWAVSSRKGLMDFYKSIQ